jgi:hypothetical protein
MTQSRYALERAIRATDTASKPVGDRNISAARLDTIVDASETQWADIALGLADRAADHHPCELSKKNNVTVCHHPDHDRDAAELRDALAAFGITGQGNRAARMASGKPRTRRVRCPVCRQRADLTVDGRRFRQHRSERGAGAPVCDGSNLPVKEAA